MCVEYVCIRRFFVQAIHLFFISIKVGVELCCPPCDFFPLFLRLCVCCCYPWLHVCLEQRGDVVL